LTLSPREKLGASVKEALFGRHVQSFDNKDSSAKEHSLLVLPIPEQNARAHNFFEKRM
jgi:hypothetical protein